MATETSRCNVLTATAENYLQIPLFCNRTGQPTEKTESIVYIHVWNTVRICHFANCILLSFSGCKTGECSPKSFGAPTQIAFVIGFLESGSTCPCACILRVNGPSFCCQNVHICAHIQWGETCLLHDWHRQGQFLEVFKFVKISEDLRPFAAVSALGGSAWNFQKGLKYWGW